MIRLQALVPGTLLAGALAAGVLHDGTSLWVDPVFTHEESMAVAWAHDEWAKTAQSHGLDTAGVEVYACPGFVGRMFGAFDGSMTLGVCWARYVCVFREQIEETTAMTPGATYEEVFAHVVLHEIGHANGLDHLPSETAVMSAQIGLPPFPLALTAEDVDGLRP